jgi:hypothetical protein
MSWLPTLFVRPYEPLVEPEDLKSQLPTLLSSSEEVLQTECERLATQRDEEVNKRSDYVNSAKKADGSRIVLGLGGLGCGALTAGAGWGLCLIAPLPAAVSVVVLGVTEIVTFLGCLACLDQCSPVEGEEEEIKKLKNQAEFLRAKQFQQLAIKNPDEVLYVINNNPLKISASYHF